MTDDAGLASASASVDAMRVMIRDAMARGRVRDDWNASMLVGAEIERRRDRAKAFLLKDGMLEYRRVGWRCTVFKLQCHC